MKNDFPRFSAQDSIVRISVADMLTKSKDAPIYLMAVTNCMSPFIPKLNQALLQDFDNIHEQFNMLDEKDRYDFALLCRVDKIMSEGNRCKSTGKSLRPLMLALLLRRHPELWDTAEGHVKRVVTLGNGLATMIRGGDKWKLVLNNWNLVPREVSIIEASCGREFDSMHLASIHFDEEAFHFAVSLVTITLSQMKVCESTKEVSALKDEIANLTTRYNMAIKANDLLRQQLREARSSVVRDVVEIVTEVDRQDEIDALVAEIARLNSYVELLQAKLHSTDSADTISEELATEAVEEEPIDLSKYKIIIVGNEEFSDRYPCDFVDLMKKPDLDKRLTYCELIVIDSSTINHGPFYRARNISSAYGIPLVFISHTSARLFANTLEHIVINKLGRR